MGNYINDPRGIPTLRVFQLFQGFITEMTKITLTSLLINLFILFFFLFTCAKQPSVVLYFIFFKEVLCGPWTRSVMKH